MTPRPLVGIGVIIRNNNEILLGLRKNAHGAQTWAPPGGHLEFGESFQACAAREVAEETGLIVTNIAQGPTTNDIFEAEQKHYVTIFMIASYQGGQPQVLEPHKCEQWQWFALDALPSPLFLPLENMLKNKEVFL